MWFTSKKGKTLKPVWVWLGMIGYGTVRFFIEYFRSPDENLGYILALGRQSDNIALFQSFFNFSMGQLFCLAMIISGIVFALVLRKKGALHVSHR